MPTYSGFTDPGSTTATALNTATYIGGSLTSTSNTFQDSLNSSNDSSDFYKFTLSSSSIVNINLDGLGVGSDANLVLRNSAGSPITNSSTTGNVSETIRTSLTNSPSNTYYVQVYLTSGSANTTYTLSLSAETIQESGKLDNSTAQANTNNDIGTFSNSGSYTATDYVGSIGAVIDGDDYYKFTLSTSGTVNINLTNLTGNADLQLRNSSNSILQPTSTQLGTAPESINSVLAPGTYYIRVFPYSAVTNYNLGFSFTADAPDIAGNTLANAKSVTLNSTPITYSDLVNQGDTKDYYRFDLTSDALVDIKFTSLSADANLQLLNQGNSTLQSSNQTGLALDSIRLSLNSGTYYVLVTPGTTTTANYTLSLSATPIGTDQAPNGYTSAKNIGTLNNSQSFNEFVGNIDTDDYYKFNLNNNSQFNLNLSGLIDNADVQLLNSSGNAIQTFNQTGNTPEVVSTVLNAGTYYIRIFTLGLANTFYNLNVNASPQTKLLQVNPTGSSDPDNFTALSSTLYFTANDGTTGVQLWKSDGNTNTRLSNITGFNPSNLIVFNNKLYFTATDSTFGTELWESNGTSVTRVSDINSGSGNSNPGNLTIAGNQLFFSAIDSSNTRKLWVYNGTNLRLVDVNPGFATTNAVNSPSTFTTAFNNRLFFTAKNNSQVWSTDGTVAGTQVISTGGVTNSYARSLTVVGSNLYFTASDGTTGQEVWKYQSGTTASLVKDITPGNNGFAPTYLTAVGNTLYFVTDSDNDFNLELWKSDGTANGTLPINPNGDSPNIGFGSIYLTALGNTLYFVANDPDTGVELWSTDGTNANTVVVKDIWTGSNNSIPTSLVNFNGTLAFAASDGTNRELWFSDGTAINTRKVSNIYSTGIANPSKLTAVGTRLFFSATDGANGTELYVI
ncbi:hypothetical protein NIES4072_03600 [Nostoc commune NIES-4072]|uniref:Peptidase C-terminal archaeal/bacterial domain-containing protein n=1 Tax=Nostoc commune NIES-4072 TaxID=2005467 RepID=A0A2R5FM53_NOSCO|nr:pre-peptidase C-terminal domain-containing protein [Nostoc commune]BBD65961.1 hypothetical protein NIES4070_23220 [Nostoc commune HK-02]GBG16714.1 hypothetical protein NIES4072_03600 [Nostoc commune NIES-4072]